MRRLFFGVLITAALVVVPALAQEGDNKLEYGDSVTGEITNQQFEIEYGFNGAAGDVVVIAMRDTAGWTGTLNAPAILLLDTDYNTLETAASYGDHVVTLYLVLPADATYMIIATRRDGRGGDSIGPYTLELLQPPSLQIGEPVQGTITQNGAGYYLIQSDTPFRVEYERNGGTFFPAVDISVIASVDRLEAVASLSGEKLIAGALGIAPDRGNPQPYLIVIHPAYPSMEQQDVQYTLTRTQ